MSGETSNTARSAEADLRELRQEVATAVVRLYRRFRSDRIDGDLGDAAITVLTILVKDGPQTLRELSDQERVTPASMSQTVNRLTAAGYAVRGPDPHDGRKVRFSTTPAGDALVAEDRSRRHNWFLSHLSELSPADRKALARAASILREIADGD
ncbi:MarR family winged helix-turn-helix transcriptional regulator [Microlunatus soli]|uniref:DNA-binding transcriptional regulator, MarR family n=1 Tax=Microlunatus soli TaxID=630515 RepID=A0A1H1ZBE4_9ACTN|nr:MarR family transcriptional regulator [Microlunatus soli]SDT30929.1 DNA-binding transcriptional regulator, MarR family [Microlunatus soli]